MESCDFCFFCFSLLSVRGGLDGGRFWFFFFKVNVFGVFWINFLEVFLCFCGNILFFSGWMMMCFFEE